MTTITFDKEGYVACDSLITVDGARLPYAIEKMWTADGKIYAFAGDISKLDAVIEWHRGRGLPEAAPRPAWSLLVVGRRTAHVFTDDAPFPSKVKAPFALGSGAPYALGALAAGASAFDAVRIAAKYDTNTGGRVNVLHRGDVK